MSYFHTATGSLSATSTALSFLCPFLVPPFPDWWWCHFCLVSWFSWLGGWSFFSVQRLNGFRQVVTHIQSRQTVELSLHAGLSTCRKPQKCRFGPVRSPEAVPARKQTRKQTKNNKANQKGKKHTTTTTTKQKRQREWDRHQQWELRAWWHLMCHSENGPKQETKQNKHKTHQWAISVGERSNKAPCGNQGSPQPGSPRSQRAAVQAWHYTLALRSKHRQRRVATRVVRNEKTVKQEGETRSKVKMTAIATALRAHSESAQLFFSKHHHHWEL